MAALFPGVVCFLCLQGTVKQPTSVFPLILFLPQTLRGPAPCSQLVVPIRQVPSETEQERRGTQQVERWPPAGFQETREKQTLSARGRPARSPAGSVGSLERLRCRPGWGAGLHGVEGDRTLQPLPPLSGTWWEVPVQAAGWRKGLEQNRCPFKGLAGSCVHTCRPSSRWLSWRCALCPWKLHLSLVAGQGSAETQLPGCSRRAVSWAGVPGGGGLGVDMDLEERLVPPVFSTGAASWEPWAWEPGRRGPSWLCGGPEPRFLSGLALLLRRAAVRTEMLGDFPAFVGFGWGGQGLLPSIEDQWHCPASAVSVPIRISALPPREPFSACGEEAGPPPHSQWQAVPPTLAQAGAPPGSVGSESSGHLSRRYAGRWSAAASEMPAALLSGLAVWRGPQQPLARVGGVGSAAEVQPVWTCRSGITGSFSSGAVGCDNPGPPGSVRI